MKVSMEAVLPLEAELAMYHEFLKVLRPPIRSTSHEDEFWQNAMEGLIKASHGDFACLCGLVVRPGDFADADSYYRAAQFAAFFRKRDDVGQDADREYTALESFFRAEEACRNTNALIWKLRYGGLRNDFVVPGLLLDALHSAKLEVRRILGRCPCVDELPCYLGPGATTQVVRKLANVRVKLGQMFACSEAMLPGIVKYLESMPDFIFRYDNEDESSATTRVQIHNARLSFVPKSFKTYRSIAVEPWLNSFFQLGIGRAMFRRMKTFGLDLSDQTPNQRMAREGSVDGSLATIDLSSASDSVSFQLVRELMPDDWFELLLECRSPSVEYRGKKAVLAKFSSMGNGYTFPLQSLIFYTVTRAVCRSLGVPTQKVRAYGDDIICPTEACDALISVLTLIGFSVNREKSFTHGPFRESCGEDYWQGIDVRPIFLHNKPNFFDLFSLHNGFVRRGRPLLAEVIRRFIPPPIALYGPDGYGDGHLIGVPFSPTFRKKHRERGWSGYTFETYTRKGRKFLRPHIGDYLYPAYSIYRRGNGEPLVGTSGNDLPDSRGYKKVSIYTLDLASIEAV